MDKETFLQNYIDIETKTFIRADKTKRLDEFLDKTFTLSFEEIIYIIDYLTQNKITIRHQLFRQILYPILATEIDKDNIQAIKSFIRLQEYYGNYQNLTEDNRFSIWKLIEKGLNIAPSDNELLKIYQEKQKNYFEYTLHELPTGVLYASDSASIEECKELLKDLTRYEEVCSKLAIDDKELIDECMFYYLAYKDYLTIYKNYKGFHDYLDKHKTEE